ncbi:MAG: alkaline phosphatase family protein [Haloarculaceae archaeon]
MDARKTVVFGLDGACFDLVEPWLDRLPTLAGLLERGGRSALESCVPATTPPAWTTLTTGVNPGEHGVFGFYERHRDGYEVSPVSDRTVHARRLWDYATEAGLTSLVVNVPVTHPARPLDGALVPGYLAPDEPTTYPESVLADLGHDDYRVYAPSEATSVPDDRLLSEWLSLTRSRAALATDLLDAYAWDLLFVEFQKTDGAVHKFDDEAAVRDVYECVDDCMADVLAAIDESVNVVVVSDHGIGQPKEWAVGLNTWLRDRGHLETTAGAGSNRREWLDAATGGDVGAGIDDGSESDATAGSDADLATTLAALGLTRQRVERVLSALGLYDAVRRIAPRSLKDAVEEETVDRAASDAFYEGMGFSGVDTGVILNDADFYDEGTLDGRAYDALRETLLVELRALEGPAGPAFSRVRPREAVYHGDRTPYAPDIVLEQAPDYVVGSTKPRGKTFIRTEPGRVDHTRHGLLIAAGPDVDPDWSLPETPSIADVTPTLAHLLGCPIAERFDGRPLTALLSIDREPETRSYDPYEPGDRYEFSADERASLEDRLREMGYLE